MRKHSFISTARFSIRTNPSRKWGLSKTLFKEESENVGFAFYCGRKTFSIEKGAFQNVIFWTFLERVFLKQIQNYCGLLRFIFFRLSMDGTDGEGN